MLRSMCAICLAAAAAEAKEPVQDDAWGRQRSEPAESLRTPEQGMAILRAAEGEALKYGLRSPRSAAAAVSGSAWVNIGPTISNFDDNGGQYFKVESGRARKILVDPRNANVVYFATAGGGVWKAYDALNPVGSGGPHWLPITESIGSLSIGALAMSPANADSLLLGLGDPFSVATAGLLSSDDGGQTWSNAAALSGAYGAVPVQASSVRDIAFDPGGQVVLAATNAGLFVSREGGIGSSWQLVPVNGATIESCWSLAWVGTDNWLVTCLDGGDGENPGSLYAGTVTSTAATFAPVTLPSTDVRRMTLAASPAALSGSGVGCGGAVRPSSGWRVYLLAENNTVGGATDQKDVYCSDDAGAHFVSLGMGPGQRAPTNPAVNTDPANKVTDQADLDFMHDQAFYNHMIAVDPVNPDTLFVGGNLCMGRSADAGGTWTLLTDWLPLAGRLPGWSMDQYVHADWHTATIVHAGGSVYFYGGTDGGIYRAIGNALTDAQATLKWEDRLNIGITSHLVFSVATDRQRPTAACAASSSPGNIVFGGLQDNGTRLRNTTTATNEYVGFDQVQGGDGFGVGMGCTTATSGATGTNLVATYVASVNVALDGTTFNSIFPDNYTTQGAPLCTSAVCTPAITLDGQTNFKMKMVTDLTAPHTYLTPLTDAATGTNYVFRSTDAGQTWHSLGTFPKPARNLAAHLRTAGVYGAVAGGHAWVKTAASSTWHDSGLIYSSVAGGYLSMTTLDFDPNEATSGNTAWVGSSSTSLSITGEATPDGNYLWKCTGLVSGTPSCAAMSTNIPANVPVNAVKYDPNDSNTLYVGTEIGMYRSTDGGGTFARYGTNLPLVSVTDIAIDADGSAIRVATYGRGFWEIYPTTAIAGIAGSGDVDHNGVIDGFDVVREAAILFADRTSPDYDAMGDTVGNNNLIDLADLSDVVTNKLGGP